jgi:hypothetical protein
MAGVRNGALGRGQTVAPGTLVLFTVGSNQTVLLKSVYVYNAGTAAADVLIQVTTSTDQVLVRPKRWSLEPDAEDFWEGWIAMNPGDKLYLYSNQAGVHGWASGADLPGVSSSLM